jgi:hypothetical protein
MKKLTCVLLFLFAAAALPAMAQGHPFTVTSAVNSATPFTVTLPSTGPDGRPIKTVVINFITADCDTPPGQQPIGAAKITVFFHSQSPIYTLPFETGLQFVNATEFVSAKQTLIFADPGTPLNYGLSAGQPTCTVAFSGYLQ